MTTLSIINSLSYAPVRRGFLLIAVALALFALLPMARAVSPAPDGGYPNNNTAEGTNALNSLTTGKSNTANGFEALFSNSSGNNNTATGLNALLNNNGSNNTATGLNALNRNTTGSDNTANGTGALFFNTIGVDNTATGFQALEKNTTGGLNTATGFEALFSNQGGGNTADGFEALFSNQGGTDNTAIGSQALFSNTTGGGNIVLGSNAGVNLTTGSNNIDIGNAGAIGESGTIRIGTQAMPDESGQTATYIAGISGVAVTGTAVVVSTNGQLGVAPSSARFKEAIKPMDKTSEAILALKPVTFRYKHELDPEGIPQFGLVAEQVEKVNPDLVARDADGKVYTVRYEAVNAMLLNEFLKEHRKVEELETTVAQLTASLKEQAAQIQKVSDQFEASKATPQIVVSNQ